jgi:peptidoglycan/LPS O-acetylase OafA/YrhL
MLSAGIVSVGGSRSTWPWAWLAVAAAAPVLAAIWWQGSVWTLDNLLWVDLALGPAIGCLLAGLATGRPAPLLRLLDARPMKSLGLSSYSLYLTHGPIVVVMYEGLVAGRVSPGVPAFLVSLALVLPVTIVVARAFSAVFERPFLSGSAGGGQPSSNRGESAYRRRTTSPIWRTSTSFARRPGFQGKRPSSTKRGACESPTKTGATTS